jgi:hypothetical protein
VAALGDELGLEVLDFAQTEADPPGREDATRPETHGEAPLGAPDQAPGGSLEIVRPVRERLWLAGEAPVDATGLAP